MNVRYLALVAAAGTIALGACKDFTGGSTITCTTAAPTITSVKGDTTTLNVGVRYLDPTVGTGATVAICQQVTVDYSLRVAGRDTAYDTSTGGSPAVFVAGAGQTQLPGLELGVVGMKVGGTRRLIIPPSLAYGSVDAHDAKGNVVVPANSTIIADITMRAVTAVNQ